MNLTNRASSKVSFLPRAGQIVGVEADAALDGHPAVVGQDVEAGLEEVVVALEAEVLEGLDRDDPVDRAGGTAPSPPVGHRRCAGVELAQQLGAVRLLVLAQRQADDVDVVLLHRALQRQAPAAADLEQRHARLEVEPVEVLVDVGDLRLGQRDIRPGEVGAAVLAGRVLEHAEEVVRQVVVSLDVLEMRPHILRAGGVVRHVSPAWPFLAMLSPPMARTSCCDRTVAGSIDVPTNASSGKP